MDIRVPHQIIYETEDAVPIGDVIESLMGTERAAKQIGGLLEGVVSGLSVSGVEVSVRSITQESPLREMFFIALAVTFQKDLETEVPEIIEKLIGAPVPDQYDTIVTLCVLIVLFYGADYAYRKFFDATSSKHIKRQLNGLIGDLARDTGKSESDIRQVLEEKYTGVRLRTIAKAAGQFLLPSKRARNAPITVGKRTIDRDTIAEMPGGDISEVVEPDSASEVFQDVLLEVHAQDMDRANQGWAATIPGVLDKRLRMQILPPVTPEDIYTRENVRGDVVLVSEKDEAGNYTPKVIHLIRVNN